MLSLFPAKDQLPMETTCISSSQRSNPTPPHNSCTLRVRGFRIVAGPQKEKLGSMHLAHILTGKAQILRKLKIAQNYSLEV